MLCNCERSIGDCCAVECVRLDTHRLTTQSSICIAFRTRRQVREDLDHSLRTFQQLRITRPELVAEIYLFPVAKFRGIDWSEMKPRAGFSWRRIRSGWIFKDFGVALV